MVKCKAHQKIKNKKRKKEKKEGECVIICSCNYWWIWQSYLTKDTIKYISADKKPITWSTGALHTLFLFLSMICMGWLGQVKECSMRQKELRRTICMYLSRTATKSSGCLLPLAKETMFGTSVFLLDIWPVKSFGFSSYLTSFSLKFIGLAELGLCMKKWSLHSLYYVYKLVIYIDLHMIGA